MSNWQFTKIFFGTVGLSLLVFYIIPWLLTDPSDVGVMGALLLILTLVYVMCLGVKNFVDRNNKKEEKDKQ